MKRVAALWLMLSAGSAFAGDLTIEQAMERFEISPLVADILHAAEADCAAFDGTMTIDSHLGIVPADLDGDGGQNSWGWPDDTVINFNFIECSSGPVWFNTGGAPIHFVLDGQVAAGWIAHDWQVVRFSDFVPALILIGRHGSVCDGYGAQSCVQAVVVQEGAFLTPVHAEPLGAQ